MEQILHGAHTWDTPHALFELGDVGDTTNLAAQNDRAMLAVDVHIAFGHVPIAEQLALDALAERLIVGDVRRARHQVHDAVRDAIRPRGRPTPEMLETSADPAQSGGEPIAQHVAAASTALAIEEIHS
jgi:hypothetical protein